ncbi:hypothetical protein MJO28_014654 [Puccinia striiformis f. sp. tritici]|uniref:Uncharacterized protein n=2 Tax=Puccinia striiformis f. sp. tritici TaxID=168172 RepID=A0ACC0DUF2_9BASI|nr:hypothetical protein MJO28_014535 [Puccinia striiformis f. sp. tritici]KAI7939075.1 hypothetical protein MJO28_014654 [Puccinia striiformis f. sp. tritici]KAI7939668.1 hypothetical protein MJO29_014404 [Puccinia striiformis f. sp. tritici]
MQLHISLGLVLLIATTVKTQADPNAPRGVTLPKVPKRQDNSCTKGGPFTASRKSKETVAYLYIYFSIRIPSRQSSHSIIFVFWSNVPKKKNVAVPPANQMTDDKTCNKLRSEFKATFSCCDYKKFVGFLDEQNKDKDIYVVTNDGFQSACPQDLKRAFF